MDVIIAGGVGTLYAIKIPDVWTSPSLFVVESWTWTEFWQAVFGISVTAIILIVTFVLFYVVMFGRAPFKQRNESWKKIDELEVEKNAPQLFDVFTRTTFLGLPINRTESGGFKASALLSSIGHPLIRHRGDSPTIIERLVLQPEIWFVNSDVTSTPLWLQSRSQTTAIEVTPRARPTGGPDAAELTWDTSDSSRWVLNGLPITVGRDETLTLPWLQFDVTSALHAGPQFDEWEKCYLLLQWVLRTNKGNPILPPQTIELRMSSLRVEISSSFEQSDQQTSDEEDD